MKPTDVRITQWQKFKFKYGLRWSAHVRKKILLIALVMTCALVITYELLNFLTNNVLDMTQQTLAGVDTQISLYQRNKENARLEWALLECLNRQVIQINGVSHECIIREFK